MTCLNRALESQESSPREARSHLRQALLGVVFGSLAWVCILAAILAMVLGSAGNINMALILLGMLAFMAAPAPAILGIGQAAAAIRARGDHMIMATIGLLLSGLQAGFFIGLFTFLMWDS